MRHFTRPSALVAAAVLAGLVGCGAGDRNAQTSTADREVVQRIRQALVSDDSLSTSAKNVTIDSKQNQVTLRGSVASEQERATVAARARQAAGDRTVENELVVASR
jgi:osmotically-inducible protein OsmY